MSGTCPNEKSVFDGEPEVVSLFHFKPEQDIIDYLSIHPDIDPNLKTKGGYSLLHMAGLSDLGEVARILVRMGADTHAIEPQASMTCIHYAATWEALDFIEALMSEIREQEKENQANADLLNAQTQDTIHYLNSSIPIYSVGGKTALHCAAEKGYVDVVQLLLDLGADKSLVDNSGLTAYDLAFFNNHLACCDLLEPSLVSNHSSSAIFDRNAIRAGVKERVAKRKKREKQEYKKLIRENYKKLHEEAFEIRKEFFDKDFWEVVIEKRGKVGDEKYKQELAALLTEVHPGIFTVRMFSEEYCELLVEEMNNFEESGLPLQRPNSMNNYGVILNHIGFKDLMYRILHDCISPFASFLYQDYGGATLDRHHSFTVKYKVGEDLDLAEHVDDSDVTLNICLGKEFTGGNLKFNGVQGKGKPRQKFELEHQKGVGVLHVGKYWHSALPISSGERWNLIVWCRSSQLRGLPLKSCLSSCNTK